MLHHWKGFGTSAAYIYRGSTFKRLLPRLLTSAYTPGAVSQAEAELAAAHARGDDNFSAASTIRVSKVVESFAKDPIAKSWHLALLLNAPQRRFLNLCFATEKHTRAILEHALAAPVDGRPVAAPPGFNDSVNKARSTVLKVISGNAGRRVLSNLTAMLLDLEDVEIWGSDLVLSRQESFKAGKDLCCATTASSKRWSGP